MSEARVPQLQITERDEILSSNSSFLSGLRAKHDVRVTPPEVRNPRPLKTYLVPTRGVPGLGDIGRPRMSLRLPLPRLSAYGPSVFGDIISNCPIGSRRP